MPKIMLLILTGSICRLAFKSIVLFLSHLESLSNKEFQEKVVHVHNSGM